MRLELIRGQSPDRFRDEQRPLDGQIADMRRLLDRMSGRTTAEALRALREAFPETPLPLRLAALSGRR